VRRICKRKWLLIESVVPFDERLATEKPRVLGLGPPVSDQSFDDDYHNREPDPDAASREVDRIESWFISGLMTRALFWGGLAAIGGLVAICASLVKLLSG
jgi:hypothetical protein